MWLEENLFGEFEEGGGGRAMAPLSLFQVHTQRKRKMAANGAFSKTLIFFKIIFIAFLGQTHVAQLEGNNLGQKISKT